MIVAVNVLHSHFWQFVEVEFGVVGAVRRFECACGAIDFDRAPAGTA